MASKIFPAALLAAATLVCGSSFAEGPIPGLSDQLNTSSGMKTRAEVKAELLQAQRQGYSPSSTNPFPPPATAPASQLTRAQVKADMMASHRAAPGAETGLGYSQVH